MVASTNYRIGNAPLQQDTRYVFSMAVVEKMTGLTRRRIRYYEKSGLVIPSRTAGGQRLYSPSNVEALLRIRDVIKSGITTMEAVARMIASDLDRPTAARSRPVSMGDAAMRLRGPETDSPGYFRRVNIMTENDRKPTN